MHILSFYTYKKTPPRSAFPFLSFCFFNSDLAILIHPFFKISIFRIFINHIINQFNQVIISFLQCNSRKFLYIRKSHISQYKIRIKKSGTAAQQSLLKRYRSACRVLTQAPRQGTLVSPTDFAPSTFWAAASLGSGLFSTDNCSFLNQLQFYISQHHLF